MNKRYTYLISHPSESEYIGTCYEFPHLSHFSPSQNLALYGIQTLVESAIDVLKERGLAIPEPLTSKEVAEIKISAYMKKPIGPPKIYEARNRWVTQTTFNGSAEGENCTEAAVASLLNIPLSSVPKFPHDPPVAFYDEFFGFLKSQGFVAIQSYNTDGRMFGSIGPRQPDCLHLAAGYTGRDNVRHMCVYRGTELIHDPHPDGNGLTSIEVTYVLAPIDPCLIK